MQSIKPFLCISTLSVLLSMAACQPNDAKGSNTLLPQVKAPASTVQDLMQALVDPSADGIWDAVSTTVTSKGIEEKKPQSDQDWDALRIHALRIIAGASLLQEPGIKVVYGNIKIEDTRSGYLHENDIAAAITKNPEGFKVAAEGLKNTAKDVLLAVQNRDIQHLIKAGGELDAACEQCHSAFWYPNQGPPAWPAKLSIKK